MCAELFYVTSFRNVLPCFRMCIEGRRGFGIRLGFWGLRSQALRFRLLVSMTTSEERHHILGANAWWSEDGPFASSTGSASSPVNNLYSIPYVTYSMQYVKSSISHIMSNMLHIVFCRLSATL